MRKRFYISPAYKKYKYSFIAESPKATPNRQKFHVIRAYVNSAFGKEIAELAGAKKIKHLITKLKKKDEREGKFRIYYTEFVEVT